MYRPINRPLLNALEGPGALSLPNRSAIDLWTRGLVDKIGTSSREVFKPQSGLFAVGDYLTGDIAGGTTVVSEEGTGSISLSEDQLDYTDDEFLWSFELSNGSIYEHPTIVGTDAIWLDTSGNGRHLTGSVSDINAHTHSDDTLIFGSDWLNQEGITVSDGATYYLNDDDTGLIPVDVPIPALADGSGCAAYLVGGSVAPLTSPGRAKYDIELVNNTCTLQDGIDTIAFTELIGTETVVSSVGTSTPSISAGQIDFTAGTCSVIVFDNGWTIPLEESEGTTVYGYEADGTAHTGTITASDIGAFWSGEKDGKNHNYLYGSTEGLVDGVELWVDPAEQTINAGTYSTYDSETGVGRIVSDGTYVTLKVLGAAIVGETYLFNYEELDNTLGFVKMTTASGVHIFNSGSEVVELVASLTEITLERTNPTDVTFKLSVQHIPAGKIPANPNTGLSVLGQPLTVLPRRLTDQTFVNVECKELMTAQNNMTDAGDSPVVQEVLYDESGNAKELTVTDDEVELLGSELVVNGGFEGTYVGGVAPDWTSPRGNTSEDTEGISGSAQAVTNPAGNTGVVGIAEVNLPLVIDTPYVISFWAKALKGVGGYVQDYSNTNFPSIYITDIDWKKYTVSFTAVGVLGLGLYAESNAVDDTNGIVVDNISVREVLTEEDNNFNNQILIAPKGEAVYEERQTDAIATKALKILGVTS